MILADNIGMSIGIRIKEARRKAGLTQAALAAKVGLAQGTIADLEGGKSKGTTLIASFAKALGVSALWLETGRGLKEQGQGQAEAGGHGSATEAEFGEVGHGNSSSFAAQEHAASERLMSAVRLLTLFNSADEDGRRRILKIAEQVSKVGSHKSSRL